MDFSPAVSGRCDEFYKVFHEIKDALYQQFFVVSTGFNRVFNTFNTVFHISTV